MAKHERRTGGQNRAAIVEAACRHIEERGTLSLRVKRLEAETGVAEAMIYRYFHDRNGVITAACTELWRRYTDESYIEARTLLEHIDDLELTPEVIADVVLLPHTGENEARRRLRVQILAASLEIPDLRAAIAIEQRRQDEMTEELIEAVTRRLGGFPITPRMQRVMFSAMAFGYAVDDLHGDDKISNDEVRSFWVEYFTHLHQPSDNLST